MNTNSIITLVVVLALLVVGGFFFFNNQSGEEASETPSTSIGIPVIGSRDTPEMQVGGETNVNPQSTAPAQTVVVTDTNDGFNPNTVTYTSDGFNPKSMTIAKGQSISFVNQSGNEMWVASAVHPSHTTYGGTTRQEHCPDTAGTAFDQCGAGGSYTFTFGKSGNWNYHNHLRASDFGTVIIK